MSGSHTASCGALHSPGVSSAEAVKGAKDDSRGTFVLADSLRTDQHCFRAIRASDPSIIRLRELSRLDEELSFCFQRHCAQLRQQLQRFFPHVLGLSQTADEPWIWARLELAPTPAKQQSSLSNGSRNFCASAKYAGSKPLRSPQSFVARRSR